ncbi:hypothetical protein PQR53_16560 [Paraburkholderia fungorum]|uniref:LPO_1073/Vpar_1526 family protein n=1 Tax=Paraburkholderia fungorum TaxID=134537 RepID=UPI0038B7DAF7
MKLGGQKQSQSSGDNSNNYQAQGDIVVQGVTEEGARQIALNVYTENFLQLGRDAADLALGRAQRLIEDYLRQQQKQAPEGLQQVNDPDFQSALFEAQKAFARSGDEDLEGLLVDILVERSGEPQRNLRQIVLNESIDTVAKLTQEHVDIITFIFLMRYTSVSARNRSEFAEIWKTNMLQFVPPEGTEDNVYSYLDYVGVASVGVMKASIVDTMSTRGSGFLSQGFDAAEGEALTKRDYRVGPLLRPSARDAAKVELAVANEDALNERIRQLEIPPNLAVELKAKLVPLMIPSAERAAALAEMIPGFAEVAARLDQGALGNTILTPVGFAIAHSNAKRAGLNMGPLEIWVK